MTEIDTIHTMPRLDSSPPHKQLPPLAGICHFHRASGDGLSIEDCVERLKRLHYSLHRVWSICLARLTSEPVYEIKMGLAYHAYLAAEHVTLLRERVAEMRHPPLGLDKVPHEDLQHFFDEILKSPSTDALISGLHTVALPAVLQAIKQHLDDTNPLADAPTVRLLNIMLPEVKNMCDWGNEVVSALATDPSATSLDAWRVTLQGLLTRAGGLDGTQPSQSLDVPPGYRHTDWNYDNTPARDARFPDPYNMGVHAEAFLYDEKFADHDKVVMMYFKRLREIDVPEMMASLLYEMTLTDPATEGSEKPWAFYRDMTRQLWDEARHAMMGEVGFAKLGVDWPSYVMVNFTWSKGLNEQLSPRERHAVLWFIEQGLMSKSGKRYEWEVGKNSGDAYAELIQDYDWADEVLHARIGRDWYVKDFDSVKEAAEFGSACWDKVVSGWEQWRDEGLTKHHNWWPDLYREVCRLRGQEPDPETLAYETDYSDSRADLKRISASG